jgi:hypothetical protein
MLRVIARLPSPIVDRLRFKLRGMVYLAAIAAR